MKSKKLPTPPLTDSDSDINAIVTSIASLESTKTDPVLIVDLPSSSSPLSRSVARLDHALTAFRDAHAELENALREELQAKVEALDAEKDVSEGDLHLAEQARLCGSTWSGGVTAPTNVIESMRRTLAIEMLQRRLRRRA